MIPCTQEDRIEKIEASVKEISKKVDTISDTMLMLTTKLEPTIDKVNDHEHILRGAQGDIGLIARLSSVSAVLIDLAVTIKGKENDLGMARTVVEIKRTVDTWSGNQKWLSRLIIGWVVTTGLGLIYFFLINQAHVIK